MIISSARITFSAPAALLPTTTWLKTNIIDANNIFSLKLGF